MSDTDSVFNNYKKLRQQISNQRIPEALTALTSKIESEAILRAPLATSDLVNSAETGLEKTVNGWVGAVRFLAIYAYPVHEASGKLLGKGVKRPIRDGRSDLGNVWDGVGGDQAEPQFLVNAANHIMATEGQQIIEDYIL